MRGWSRLSVRMLAVFGMTLMTPLILQSGWLFYELSEALMYAPIQALSSISDERMGVMQAWTSDRLALVDLLSHKSVCMDGGDLSQFSAGMTWVIIQSTPQGSTILEGPVPLKGTPVQNLSIPAQLIQSWVLILGQSTTPGQIPALAIPQEHLTSYLQKVGPWSPVKVAASRADWQVEQQSGRSIWRHQQDSQQLAIGEQPDNANFFIVSYPPQHDPIRQRVDQQIQLLAWVLVSLLILCCAAAWFLTKRLARPIDRLLQGMEEVAAGDLSVRLKPSSWGFEMNEVYRSFNEMLDHFNQAQAQVVHEKALKEGLAHELTLGKEIQNALLPSRHLRVGGVELAAYYQAAKDVGGDFYDFVGHRADTGEEGMTITIADVSGKGLAACLYSISYRALYRAFSYEATSFDQVVDRVNRLLCWDTQDSGYFVTAWMGYFHPKTGALRYISAGHPLAIIIRKDGALDKLSTPGLALGVDRNYPYRSSETTLAPGESLVIYTDGLIEQPNPQGEFYGEARLWELLLKQTNRSADDISEAISASVQAFAQSAAQYDDLTFVVLRRTVETE